MSLPCPGSRYYSACKALFTIHFERWKRPSIWIPSATSWRASQPSRPIGVPQSGHFQCTLTFCLIAFSHHYFSSRFLFLLLLSHFHPVLPMFCLSMFFNFLSAFLSLSLLSSFLSLLLSLLFLHLPLPPFAQLLPLYFPSYFLPPCISFRILSSLHQALYITFRIYKFHFLHIFSSVQRHPCSLFFFFFLRS